MKKIYTVLSTTTGTSKSTGRPYCRFSWTYDHEDGFTEAGTDFASPELKLKKGDRVTPKYRRHDTDATKWILIGFDKVV